MTTMLRELKRRIHTRCVKSLMILYTMQELLCSDRARNHPRFSKSLAPCYRAVWHQLVRQATTRSKMEDRPGLCPYQKMSLLRGMALTCTLHDWENASPHRSLVHKHTSESQHACAQQARQHHKELHC